ncbi:MAG: phosphoribosylanthranilate isomerase [Parvularculaceae bacterium]|nr:phosphoribosylanthranilate isomerase [Parvularculaceae bacterium]
MAACFVKICGVKSVDHAIAAARAGADMIGFVFVAKSPRAIAPDVASDIVTEIKQLAYEEGFAPPKFCGLFIDAGERLLGETAPFLSHFQFHGHEDAERVDEIRSAFGLEIIKAVNVAPETDFGDLAPLAEAADMLLFDARPPRGAVLPGGNGLAFDWSALRRYQGETPFLLAGGLNAGNVAAAIKTVGGHTAFSGVDVSSGVETGPGEKNSELIETFIKTAKAAAADGV